MATASEFQIEGQWEPADDSRNHLELAKAKQTTPDGDTIVLMRDTFSPDTVIPATRKQVQELVRAYDGGKLDRLFGGRSGGSTPSRR